ncbi:MAG: dipeptide/oligopeptide/nickel ABC transporter ATP-binding protein [Candidatus Nitrosopolaris wilkensis]|nr:MAG: dipeptide/oligopeptide/nickel ABC transporter ATP-binding protein [Candidatus Nitrosopolaris wilkensis]
MTELSQAKLSVVGLKAYYFANKGVVKAVDNITFAIGENESLGIAGESACGKSTLGSALLRALQPPGKIIGGNVIISGIDIVKLSDKDFNKSIRWKKIAMIFQGAMNTLDPVYKIGDQMREIMQIHHFKGNIEDSILESLEQVGLDRDVAKRFPHELSGGMKQRVVIAMALLLKPDIVIADEPTTALDVLVQAQIVNVLKRLKKENGMTIILITHDLGIISEIADKIAVMYAGQIVEIGKASDIYENPKHPYTQALISAIPTLHDSNKQIEYIKGNPPDLTRPPPGCRFYERCPHAMGICKEDPPEIATETGFTRCWLYVKS